MADNYWVGGGTAVVQVITVPITGVIDGDDSVTITLKDDAGNDHDIVAANEADIPDTHAALLVAAAAAKTAGQRPYTEVTVAGTTPNVAITADTAGVRFYASTSVVGGAVATAALTTNNSGPNDFLTAENWSTSAIPTDNERLVFPVMATDNVLYGLKQQTNTIAGLDPEYAGIVVEQNADIVIGHNRQSLFIRLDTGDSGTEIRLAGRGQKFLYFENGSADDPLFIDQSASSTGGSPGTVIETADVVDYDVKIRSGGSIGFATGGISGVTGVAQVMKIDDLDIDGSAVVTLGIGVSGAPDPVLTQGSLETHVTLGTMQMEGSTWTHHEGDIGTINMLNGQTTLLSEALTANTTLNLSNNSQVTFGPRVGVAAFTLMTISGIGWTVNDEFNRVVAAALSGCRPSDGVWNGPRDKTWTIS